MSPGQYTENVGGEIDPSLPDTLRPLLCLSFSSELSNGLVLCQPECLQQGKKKAMQMNWTPVHVLDLILKSADELCLTSGLQEMSRRKHLKIVLITILYH